MASLSPDRADVDLRREQLKRQRVTDRNTLTPLALAAAIALAAVACDGESGAGHNEVTSARESPTMVPETPAGLSFGDPRTEATRPLFEVEAEHGEYWRMFTLDRFDGQTWTSTNADGSEGGVLLSAPTMLPRSGGAAPPRAETLATTSTAPARS